jgi:hypothetical protein
MMSAETPRLRTLPCRACANTGASSRRRSFNRIHFDLSTLTRASCLVMGRLSSNGFSVGVSAQKRIGVSFPVPFLRARLARFGQGRIRPGGDECGEAILPTRQDSRPKFHLLAWSEPVSRRRWIAGAPRRDSPLALLAASNRQPSARRRRFTGRVSRRRRIRPIRARSRSLTHGRLAVPYATEQIRAASARRE